MVSQSLRHPAALVSLDLLFFGGWVSVTAAEGLVVVVDNPSGDGAGCLRLVGDVRDGKKWIL